METPRCPICGKQPQRSFGGKRHIVSCCGLRARGMSQEKAEERWRRAVEGHMLAEAAWDKALGIPTEAEREGRELRRMMANTDADKRLNQRRGERRAQ